MTWLMAVLVGLIGVAAVVGGGLALFVARAARKAFEAALTDDSDDGLRARGVLLVERVRSPALRWIVNRRTGAVAGRVAAGVVRDRLSTLHRGGIVTLGVGAGAIVLAAFMPDMLR